MENSKQTTQGIPLLLVVSMNQIHKVPGRVRAYLHLAKSDNVTTTEINTAY